MRQDWTDEGVLEQTIRRIQVDLLRHLDNLAVFRSEHEALVRIQKLRKWKRRRRLGKGFGNYVILIIRMRKSLNDALPAGAYRGAYVIRGRRPKGTGLVQRKASAWYHVLMMGIESNKQAKTREWWAYSIGICDGAWKRMGEITPGRYEHATRRRREIRVADDLEERQ